MSNNENNFHFIVPVWGKTYTKRFTEVCLPLILTPGNMYAKSYNHQDVFNIVTTWNDQQVILKSRSYLQLKKIIAVNFILIDCQTDLSNAHQAMSYAYSLGMKTEMVIPGKTFFIFLTPDSFWSENTFKRLFELANSNYKVALSIGLRVNSDAAENTIKNRLTPSGQILPFTKDELITFAINNLHTMCKSLDWLSKDGFLNSWPSNIFWINYEKKQLIAHCYHLHPIMVQSSKVHTKIYTTIDGEFINNLRIPREAYYVSQDDFFGVELSDPQRNWGQPLRPPSIKDLIRFHHLHAKEIHKFFFKQRVSLIPSDTTLPNEIDELISAVVNSVPFCAKSILDKFGLAKMYSKLYKAAHYIMMIPKKIYLRLFYIKKFLKNLYKNLQ